MTVTGITSRRWAAAALALVSAVTLANCGSSSTTSASCGPVTRESLDPRSLQHVLPSAPPPSYLTDPPTSGPHQPTPPVDGVQQQPIPAVQQVGLLEGGMVVVQYHGLREAQVQQVEALAGDAVVIAPADALPDGAAVVATSWLHKQTCSALDTNALQDFIDARSGHGPEQS